MQDLYHELHALDRFEQEYNSKLKGKDTERFEKGTRAIYTIFWTDRYCTMCPLPEIKGIVEAKENNFSLAISLSCKCPNPFIMTVAVVLWAFDTISL